MGFYVQRGVKMSQTHLYRVNFIGRLKGSLGHTTDLQKTLTFDSPQNYETIKLKLYDSHEHIRVLKIVDLSKAAIHREVKP